MKLTGPACTEAMNEAEEARRRERAEDNAGGVRVERRVRQTGAIGKELIALLTIHDNADQVETKIDECNEDRKIDCDYEISIQLAPAKYRENWKSNPGDSAE